MGYASKFKALAKMEGITEASGRTSKAFFLRTSADIIALNKWSPPRNVKVTKFIINLTGKFLTKAENDSHLPRILEIVNNSNGYQRYEIKDGKIVEAPKASARPLMDESIEPEKYRRYSDAVMGEEYVNKYRRTAAGKVKTMQERIGGADVRS